jgi:hypothetical protein
LREIVQRQRSAAHTIVLVGAKIELPEELEALALRVPLSLPDIKELAGILRGEAAAWQREQGRASRWTTTARTIVRNLLGPVRAGCAAHRAQADLQRRRAQSGRPARTDAGEVRPAQPLRPAALRIRHRQLRRYRRRQPRARMGAAAARGVSRSVAPRRMLDPPKGVLLLGVQGCGKSLASKAIAGGFGVPLVRLDFGTLYNKYQGETEKNLREALASTELLAPCVLWIDEIEKGLAGGGDDGGVSRRVLGYLLTWMAERKAKVFVVATANTVDELPAELLRKGRFDEIFFVDLPQASVRADIFTMHLTRRKLDPTGFDLPVLAEASSGFSGAEVEQTIVSALYDAASNNVPLDQSTLLNALKQTRPLSVLMYEKVETLRAWAVNGRVGCTGQPPAGGRHAFRGRTAYPLQGSAGEQATMFLLDPCGNALEFKAFADRAQLFAK